MQNGSLAVFSPVALTPEVRSAVDSLGSDVKYIAALDYEHHIFLSEWSRAYPSASLIGVEGLPEKREQDPATAGSKFRYVWTAKNKHEMHVDSDFDREFDVEYVNGHLNKELVFNHKPTKTLIQADLIFNLPAYEQFSKSGQHPETGFLNKLVAGLTSTKGTAIWQKRFIWYVAAKDRPAVNQSVSRIARWDFNRIIPCHGDVIETGGKGIFQKMFEWHLSAQK